MMGSLKTESSSSRFYFIHQWIFIIPFKFIYWRRNMALVNTVTIEFFVTFAEFNELWQSTKLEWLPGILQTGADPGFPVWRGHQPWSGGRQDTNLPDFSKNCMKWRTFWSVGEGCPPLDPPLPNLIVVIISDQVVKMKSIYSVWLVAIDT